MLTNEHIFLAFAQVEWDMFAEVMRDVELNPHTILQAIEEALWRIERGTYGVCRDCGGPIAPARLNAIPWTRVCISCKEKQSS